jgi:hypothetical protein
MQSRSPLTAKEIVDEYFVENRTRLLEIAAFLDRLDRAEPGHADQDFRMKAFAEALGSLTAGRDRLDRLQLLFSDPTTEPLAALDRKSALGAYDRWSRGAGAR